MTLEFGPLGSDEIMSVGITMGLVPSQEVRQRACFFSPFLPGTLKEKVMLAHSQKTDAYKPSEKVSE